MIEPPRRVYTAAEANAALPEVDPVIARIRFLTAALPELHEAVGLAHYRWSRQGSGSGLERAHEESRQAQFDAETELGTAMGRLAALGVVLKDPQVGLVDFYGYRDGELVELCWKLGEPAVEFWHRIGDGFAGRQPL